MRKLKNKKEAKIEFCSVVPEYTFYTRLVSRIHWIHCSKLLPEKSYNPNCPQQLKMTNVKCFSQKGLSLHPELRRPEGKGVGRIEDYRGNSFTQKLKMKMFRTKREERITR